MSPFHTEPPLIHACVWTLVAALVLGLMTQLTGRALPGGLDAAILIVAALIPAVWVAWERRRLGR